MANEKISPIRKTDDTARALARDLIHGARIAAMAVQDKETPIPHVTRIAFGLSKDGTWLTLISSLATHFDLLMHAGQAGLLIGEAPQKGDPLAFPRMSVAVTAERVARDDPHHIACRDSWLGHHPKSALYIDFADFSFVKFTPLRADLNGGFGKAYRLTAEDLTHISP